MKKIILIFITLFFLTPSIGSAQMLSQWLNDGTWLFPKIQNNVKLNLGATDKFFLDASTTAHTDTTGAIYVNFASTTANTRGGIAVDSSLGAEASTSVYVGTTLTGNVGVSGINSTMNGYSAGMSGTGIVAYRAELNGGADDADGGYVGFAAVDFKSNGGTNSASGIFIGKNYDAALVATSGDIAFNGYPAAILGQTKNASGDNLTVKAADGNDDALSGNPYNGGDLILKSGAKANAGTDGNIQLQPAGFVNIDQNSDVTALAIDTESTTAYGIAFSAPVFTTGVGLAMTGFDSLTGGGIAVLESNSADATARRLFAVTNDNAAATGAIVARFQQDSTATGIYIDKNDSGAAMSIDADANSASDLIGLTIYSANTGTGGNAAIAVTAGINSYQHTFTSITSPNVHNNHELTVSPTANSDGNYLGALYGVKHNSAFNLTSTFPPGLIGSNFEASNLGAGTVALATGIVSGVSAIAGSITDAYGAFLINNTQGTGTITDSVNIGLQHEETAGTITNAIGIDLFNHTGTPTNTYLLRLAASSDWLSPNGNLVVNNNGTPNYITLSTVDDGGVQIWNVTTVNAATYDLGTSDFILHVTYTATGAVTSLTLMTAGTVTGRMIHIKDAGGNAATNNITVDTEGAQTIDGIATYVIMSDYESISLYSDGTNWFLF